jgi:hypothetical protein
MIGGLVRTSGSQSSFIVRSQPPYDPVPPSDDSTPCPLLPRKQTFCELRAMSVLCQKQTSRPTQSIYWREYTASGTTTSGPLSVWHSRSYRSFAYHGRAIGRLFGSGIFALTGSSSVAADARVFAALLRIASAACWNAATAFSSSSVSRSILVDTAVC